jgi:hypothetical protein
MLLFEDDLHRRQKITALFLRAQALLGLGERAKGFDLLQQVQSLDQNHSGAIDLLRMGAQ